MTGNEDITPLQTGALHRPRGEIGSAAGQLVRVAETERQKVKLIVDGVETIALVGDTLLVAILTNSGALRVSEFGDGARAGFCLMGACQDCWVWTDGGTRLRACSTRVEPDMQIITKKPEGLWPRRA